ncbi:hypothetical protein KZZ20_01510 [Methylacidiphilum fumariolicum]|uniref:hypothetical protein n=1 Tax=Candidatus Methylacidiphilum fumarolicum TaxID=591154 RepID=UPI0002F97F54|nr:hypothetical protein [Candidatus Methylacidiphilum fumarolicum]MBW6414206.1 hypothetical protein [Candidatus Methylacidiphilum fumarolicum]
MLASEARLSGWSSSTRTGCCALVRNWYSPPTGKKNVEVVLLNQDKETTFEEAGN